MKKISDTFGEKRLKMQMVRQRPPHCDGVCHPAVGQHRLLVTMKRSIFSRQFPLNWRGVPVQIWASEEWTLNPCDSAHDWAFAPSERKHRSFGPIVFPVNGKKSCALCARMSAAHCTHALCVAIERGCQALLIFRCDDAIGNLFLRPFYGARINTTFHR